MTSEEIREYYNWGKNTIFFINKDGVIEIILFTNPDLNENLSEFTNYFNWDNF